MAADLDSQRDSGNTQLFRYQDHVENPEIASLTSIAEQFELRVVGKDSF